MNEKKRRKNNLSLPFERELTKRQEKLYDKIKEVCGEGYVIDMTYPELFDVLERIKVSYQLDLAEREGLIKFLGEKR